MKVLRLGKGLHFPLTSVTHTFGILAVRGAGKSNAAAVMAEEMFAAELPFVAVDPVGAWWGLRSSQDGKGPGLPIPIFGGKHGDVPLERGGGQLIADLIVDQRLSCVLDISDFDSESSRKQFLLDFAKRLYQKNTDPLHLFLEEADDYIPQKPMRDEALLLRAWENIVRRGRARGLGITLITQRSAVINKNVLTQIETLITLRTTSPQDRAAVEAWVKYHDTDKEIVRDLPGLHDGEAYIWSPTLLGGIVDGQFRRRKTFDSGATPTSRSTKRAATLADVDLDDIRKRMTATIEKARNEDPRLLRQRIAELEAKLRSQSAPVEKIKRIEVPAIKPSELKRVERLTKQIQEGAVALSTVAKPLLEALVRSVGVNGRVETVNPKTSFIEIREQLRQEARPKAPVTPSQGRRPPVGLSERMGSGEQAILEVVAQTPNGATPEMLTVFTGYKRSTRDAYLQRLYQRGFAVKQQGRIWITTPGENALPNPVITLPTGEALLKYWIDELPEGESKILDALSQRVEADKGWLQEQTGFKRSTLDAYVQRLRARELVNSDRGTVALSEHLL